MMRLFLVSLAMIWTSAASVSAEPAKKLDYIRDIRPILSEHCFRCHGPDEEARRGGLRLDVRENAIHELDSGYRALVPGDVPASEAIVRIEEKDPDFRMPPKSVVKRVSEEELASLKKWIEQGAEYQQHWAFLAPSRPALPSVNAKNWASDPLDRFVLAKQEKLGLHPSPEATRYAWIRRVTLDLTGLPPSLDEVDAFVNDTSPDAYAKVADRILASTAYGERWARVWLDLARYADSAGYAQDPPRTIWRYREWVIQALNDNKPFDRFTIEQLAGDMLPSPSEDQLIATAFHRNTMTNSEGGTNDEEFRSAAVVDRTNTTMQVWMGLTMGCAQCHSHKYDPISQEEYFQFYAIFNNTEDADRGNESPTLPTFTEQQIQQKRALEEEIRRLQKLPIAKKESKPKEVRKGPLASRYLRVQLIGKQAFLHLAEVQVFSGGKNVALSGKASQISTDFAGPAKFANDGNTNGEYSAKSTSHTGKADNPWWEIDLGKPTTIERVVVWNRTDGGTAARLKEYRVIALDEKRKPTWIAHRKQPPMPKAEFALPATFEKRDAETLAELARYESNAPTSPHAKQIAALKKKLAAIKPVTTPIFRELPEGKRRKTHIQVRGNFMVKGKEVQPGVPEVFPELPKGADANRLALARWLVDPQNPLTARVTVNRFWEELFGVGIVETSEDFGTQGEPPSHPELMDYLALEFIQSGWDVKALLRRIVLSSTYRQTSRVSPELLEVDPNNRLLTRGPRFRLSAEQVRDQALAVSGLLSRKMYGESVRPPRPQLGLRAAFGGSTDWQPSPGEDRYRRGLYTSWRRTTPYPSMVTFDATSREVCTIRRLRTNTPLQALVTLNDPVFVESAQALARRMVREGGATPRERITYGFRLALSRPPTPRELDRLERLYEQVLAELKDYPEDAKALAEKPLGPTPTGMDVRELASWTVLGNVLLNLDEVLARQ